MGIAATCGSPKGFPGGGQVRGGRAAAELPQPWPARQDAGRVPSEVVDCLKLVQLGLLWADWRETKQLVSGCRIRSERVAG